MKEEESITISNKQKSHHYHLSKLQKRIYDVYYLLLAYHSLSTGKQICFIVIEIFQMLSFPFNIKYSSIWKNDILLTLMRNLFYYTRIVPLFIHNTVYYLILFYLVIIWLIALAVLTVYLISISSQKRPKRKTLLSILHHSISLYTTVLYIPILDLLTSTLILKTQSKQYGQQTMVIQINLSDQYFIHFAFAIITMLFFIIITVPTVILYYERRQGMKSANSKLTSSFDCILYAIKFMTLIIYFTDLTSDFDKTQLMIPTFLFLSSVYLLYNYIAIRPSQSRLITKAYISLLSLYTWANFVLIIGNITKASAYNGSFTIFFLGIPLLFFIILALRPSFLLNSRNRTNPLLKTQKFLDEGDTLRYLIDFRYAIEERGDKDNNRMYYEYFIEYAYCQEQEERSLNMQTPIKKYLMLSFNDSGCNTKPIEIDSNIKEYYLLLHLDQLYHEAIAKYPLSVSIRIAYALFLMDNSTNKKNQSLQELNKIEQYQLSFEETFIVFRLKKMIEEYSQLSTVNNSNVNQLGFSCTNSNSNENNGSSEILDHLSFQFHFNQLVYYIMKVSRIYLSFWTLLQNRSQNVHEDIVKLSNYGYEINDKLQDVKLHFIKVQEAKLNDHRVLVVYSKFLKEVINDDKESQHISELIKNVEDIQLSYDENELNMNGLSLLGKCSDFHYIVASGVKNSLGMIINSSLGICGLFGYAYEEIIGSNIDMFLPEFMQCKHKKMLSHKIEVNNYQQDNTNTNTSSKPKSKPNGNSNAVMKEIRSFGKTKSKYLTPIKLKTSILPNEKNEINIVAKITSETMINPGTCFVLTNNNLMIQSFTPSALNILGMNNKGFNSSMDITQSIKEFCEEFLQLYTDNQSQLDKQKLKIKMLKEKYIDNLTVITWKKSALTTMQDRSLKNNNNKSNIHRNSHNITDINDLKKQNNNSNNSLGVIFEEVYLLSVSEIVIEGEVIGYVFKFDFCDKKMNSQYSNVKGFGDYSAFTPKHFTSKKILGVPTCSPIAFRRSQGYFTLPNEESVSNNYFPMVNDQFLPEKNQLAFDPSTMSYYIDKKPKETINEYFNREVKYKMQLKEKRTHNSTSSEYEDSDDDGYGDEEDDSYTNSSQMTSSLNHNEDTLNPNKEIDNTSLKPKSKDSYNYNHPDNTTTHNESYYKVNMSKIKLFIYDYRKKMVIENASFKPISQVETKKNDTDKDEVTTSDKLSSKNMRKCQSLNSKSSKGHTDKSTSIDKTTNDLEAEIESSLNKINQPIAFFRLRLISFAMVSLLSIIAIIYIFLFFDHFTINKSLNLAISSGYSLLTDTFTNTYFFFELVLIQQRMYRNFYQTREDYTHEVQSKLLQAYNRSNAIINDVLTSNLHLSKDKMKQIETKPFVINVTNSNRQKQSFNMTIIPVLFESMSSLYSFASLNDSLRISFIDEDYLLVTLNAVNGTSVGLQWLLELIQQEQRERNKVIHYVMIVLLVILVVCIVFIFERLMMVYSVIEKRKEWYLTIFYDMDEHVIGKLIGICEHFITKMQNKGKLELNSESFDNDLSSDMDNKSFTQSKTNGNGNGNTKGDLLTNMKYKKMKSIRTGDGIKNNSISNSSNSSLNQWLNKREKIWIYVTLSSYFLLQFLLLLLFSILYYQFTKKFEEINTVFRISYKFEIYFIEIFNSIRSYAMLFSINSPLFIIYKNLTQTLIDEAYTKKPHFWNTLSEYNNKGYYPNNLTQLYTQLFYGSLCPIIEPALKGNLIESQLTCETFGNNALSYGLDIALTYFILHQRKLFNQLDEMMVEYHKTDTDGDVFNPYVLFNSDEARDMCVIWHYLLNPLFEQWRNGLWSSIEFEYKKFNVIAVGFFTVVLLINVCFYMCYIRPKQTFLMTGLEKTKNMLSIMPKEVLYQILISNS